MATILALGICFLLGYLIGSVNFAVIIARSQGIDIMQEGSKNPGATNIKRVMGSTAGNLVFGFDAIKGAAGTFLPFFILWYVESNFVEAKTFESAFSSPEILYPLVFGFSGTIIGHCFSLFLKFKGGKGVASTIGGLLVIMPYPIIIGAIIWVIAFQYTRYVSVASLALGISLPISCLIIKSIFPLLNYNYSIGGFASLIALFNIWTHRANIIRLREGTESRFGDKAK